MREELKLADVTLIHKKCDATKTKNYRPVSVLPPVYKLFLKILQKQIISDIEKYLSMWLYKGLLSSAGSLENFLVNYFT